MGAAILYVTPRLYPLFSEGKPWMSLYVYFLYCLLFQDTEKYNTTTAAVKGNSYCVLGEWIHFQGLVNV